MYRVHFFVTQTNINVIVTQSNKTQKFSDASFMEKRKTGKRHYIA